VLRLRGPQADTAQPYSQPPQERHARRVNIAIR
jgi:hypothetical protein